MRRVAAGVGVVLLAALVSALLLVSPTQADPKKLKVSHSAAGPWVDSLADPLFDELGTLVPQDEVARTFYVKNNSKQPARATLAVVDRGPGNELAEHLSFSTTVGGVTSEVPVAVDSKKKCRTYVTGPNLEPGAVQPVDVAVRFADVAGQTAMDQTASVDFVLTLSQVGPKGQVDICGVQATAEPEKPCGGQHHAVVTAIGRSSCAQVAGVQATRGRGPAGSGTTLGDSGAPRDGLTALVVGSSLLLAGSLLVRRRGRAIGAGPDAPGPAGSGLSARATRGRGRPTTPGGR